MANNTLRTKTIAALTAQAEKLGMKADELIRMAENFIDGFCESTEKDARDLILKLKTTPPATAEEESAETAAETATATEDKPKKKKVTLEDILSEASILEIGVENVGKFCGDLTAAYKAAHPECWLNSKDEYPEDLQKALQGDITILGFVTDKCKEALYHGEAALSRTIFLLSSKEENKRFGGLRSLHMNFNQAVFLKEAANQIGEYLKSLMGESEPINGLPIPEGIEFPKEAPTAPTPKTTKTAKPSKKVKEQPIVNKDVAETPIEETPAEPVAIPQAPARKLDTHRVINRMGDVRSFISLADKLSKAGIDPALLLEKEDSVKAMIKKVVKAMDEI